MIVHEALSVWYTPDSHQKALPDRLSSIADLREWHGPQSDYVFAKSSRVPPCQIGTM
jgi:hypothetical protein